MQAPTFKPQLTNGELRKVFPSTLFVQVGDTVLFTTPEFEPHNVYFYNQSSGVPPPYYVQSPTVGEGIMVNALVTNPPPPPLPYTGGLTMSPVLIQGSLQFQDSWNVTFGKPGTYTYTCLVHYPFMLGKITVVDQMHNKKNKANIRNAQKQLAASEKVALAAYGALNAEAAAVAPVRNPDGTYTRTFTVGASVQKTMHGVTHHLVDFIYFFPYGIMQAQPNDTIRFVLGATNYRAHTVTLLAGRPFSELYVIAPQHPNTTKPHVLLNPIIATPVNVGVTIRNRSTFFNSGLLSASGNSSIEIKLGNIAPGPLTVVCLLHGPSRLVATIYVNATNV